MRNFIEKLIEDKKNQIIAIIDTLNSMLARNDPDTAFKFLKTELPEKLNAAEEDVGGNTTHTMNRQINHLLRYAELAVFFYAAGDNGHTLHWSF